MVTDKTIVDVRNLVDHKVVYKLPEDNIRREFQGFEVKKISAGELRKLNYTYGGRVLLTQFLNVGNDDLASEFGVDSDAIEYKWTESDVDRVLLEGSVDELLDALDFAPEGIIELIKDRAVFLKIPDMNKRKIISEKTGFDIDNTVKMVDELEKDSVKEEKPATKTRRTNKKDGKTTERRVKPVEN